MSTTPNETDSERDDARVIQQALAGLADYRHDLTPEPESQAEELIKRWTRRTPVIS